ncbi:NAD(P)-binding protein [Xylariaceae sp. FL0594]|nr:NAD(P)-binding protein [Xylariaceae sp. FL0594]
MSAASLPFDTSPEKRATVRATLWRQFFVAASPVEGIDLKGKTAVVTGSSGGIGLETARQLLGLGLSRLILAVRNLDKGQKARSALLSNHGLPETVIDVWELDLLSYNSITAFAQRATTLDRLDIAVLNAGVFKQKFELINHHGPSPSPSHEEAIQVNVLSNTLLSALLLPVLRPRDLSHGPGRLVVVSSDVTSFAKFKERNNRPLLPSLNNPETFSQWERYCTSKLLGLLAITELARRVDPASVIITLPSPGLVYGTNLGHLTVPNIGDRIGDVLKRIFGRHVSVGTRTITAAAVMFGPEAHGQFVEDGKLQPLPPFAYQAEGERVSKLLWDEIMNEPPFATVKDVLKELRPSS